MADGAKIVREVDLDYTTRGIDEAISKTRQLASDMDRLSSSVDRSATADDKASAARDRSTRAKTSADAAAARAQRQIEAENRALAAMEQAQQAAAAATSGLTSAQMKAVEAYAAVTRAGNDNAAAVSRTGEAFKSAGKFIAEHPILVLGASVVAARALAGLATSAAGSLGAASASTAAFAEGAAGMGAAVVGGATLAARGLGLASSAATASAAGLGAYAEKVAGLTTATSLLTRGLALVPPFLLPIAAGFLVFEAGAAAIRKAGADLDKLVQLGERAEKLDVSAGFLKAFESLAPKLRTTTDAMDSMLGKASSFLRDSWGQGNGLSKMLGEISATGAAGAGGLQATALADTATTIEQRIRAALEAMKELDALGLHLASLQVGERVFGPEFAERVRTGQTSVAQIVADLDAAAAKDLVRQEQVDRAVALNRQIADTKQAISDAWAVTVDFSGAALLLNEAWLKILQAVQWVLEKINDGIAAVTNFGAAVASSIGGALDAAANKASDLLAKFGIISKQAAAAEVQGPPEQYGPFQPKITGRSFPYVFGPTAPSFQQANAGAQQAKQAATEATSAYDNLIQRTKDRIEELDLETRTIGQNTDAVIRMKLNNELNRAAQKSGIDVTAEMRAEWDRLGASLAASTDRLSAAKREMEVTREAQRELGDQFGTFAEDLILGGRKIGEAFSGLAKTFASGSLKALLTGQGGLAGLYGTAPEKSGELGGLLGGKFSLSSLFPTREIREAVTGGTADGNASFWDGIFKQKQSAQGAPQGFFSSPIGGAIASVGAGAATGYASQSPLMGGLSGVLAGAMTGNPFLAAAGGIAGIAGGACGHKPSRKKDRDHERRQRHLRFA
ncbi:hypothetical protein Q8W71_06885 [Methylobacterium sp. NEAU 140]|uniref:hypothetical protein n=1 Tax=Methylobacterium sp. NEAU 140 TaxID=3064945 RepID=UPI002732B44A|nr:hypothetical protein [Methylobacterium sp. NEAU 140]MDP4022342.1 hypothetical protein [Methylobacterium sp. NEAU 140]